jgi:hypothetical protein
VKVLRFLSNGDRKEAQRYKRDAGASFTDWRHRPSEQLKALVLAEFHALVVSDGMHPQAVHKAFLVIDEYREVISPDIMRNMTVGKICRVACELLRESARLSSR